MIITLANPRERLSRRRGLPVFCCKEGAVPWQR
jgi:hypothetical protein